MTTNSPTPSNATKRGHTVPDNDDNTPATPATPGRPSFRVVDPASTERAPDLSTDTDPHTDPTDAADSQARPGSNRSDWPRWANTALNQLDAGARRVVRFINADPEGAARLVGAAIIGLLVLTILADLMEWAVNGNPLQDLAGILPARELVTDPLQQWFTTHTDGTGIDVETAAWTWGITGVVVWFFACCNQLGAQLVAWPAYGAATIAMAWFGTTTAAHRPVAAGLVAIVWFVLSLFALNRRPKPRYRRVVVTTDKKEEATV